MKFRIVNISIAAAVAALALAGMSLAQLPAKPDVTAAGIRIGEKLTYNISFQKYENVGFAELFAVSRGKLGDADAVELRMKIKTTGLLSAAFYQIDETRTTFVNPETGMPILIRKQDNLQVLPKEVVTSYLTSPAAGPDLLALIYRARQSAGSGSFILTEGDRTYSVTFQPQSTEHVRTDAGEFETTLSNVQSEFLSEHGIQMMRINFSADEAHLPVMLRFKTTKGEFKALLSGLLNVEPEVETSPTPAATPAAVRTPVPRATPTPYVDNQPLAPELGFQLGERLVYQVSSAGKPVGKLQLEAKERKFVRGEDTLLLEASVVAEQQGSTLFGPNDSIVAYVDPDTLSPFDVTTKLSGPLSMFSGNIRFDTRTGSITIRSGKVEAPIGTHTLLSLLYAVRSFNLNPSKDPRNPVNDTRVAVFWVDQANIFMLRPFEPEPITLNGQKVLAQKITIRTSDRQLDELGLTLWLGMDEGRLPLMIKLGSYQAELIATTRTAVK